MYHGLGIWQDVMTDEEKVRHAKELAARESFELYAKRLQKLLEVYGVPLALVDGTAHEHTAVLLDGQTAVGIKCRWEFELLPEKVAEMVRQAKAEGNA